MRWSQTLSIPCLSLSLIPIISVLLLSTPSHAQQAFTPIPYFYSHSNFIEKVALYVHGGKTNTNANSSDQTFYLDLSRPWSTSSPVFISIASKFPSQGTTSTLINNNSDWLMIYGRTAYTYTFRNAQWSKPTVDPNLNSNPNMPMVFDPTQKQVYIINGYINVTDDGVLGAMRYDPSVPTVMNPMRESTRLPLDGGYAAVWSTALNVVLAYGGFVRSTPPTYSETLYEFNPQNPKFLSMGGTNSPAARYGHCMVEAYGGSQIILFGGVDQNNAPLSDLHILDVATLTWTQQKVTSPPLGRAYPCCAVTNDMFVAWSGAQWDKGDQEFKVIDKEITLVFNLKTKQWQSTFSPDPVVLPSTTSTHGNTTATATGHPAASATTTLAAHEVSIEAVVGGAIAGLAVVLVGAAGLLYVCRMKAKKKGWTWKLLSRKDDSLPPPDQKNLTSAAVPPAGSGVAEEAALNRHNHGGDNDDIDDNDDDHHSLHGAGTKSETASLKSEALSGYGFRIGKHNFVQLEQANSSEAGPIYQMVQIHNPIDILSSTSLSTSQEKQQQHQEEPLMSTSTICLIPYSPATSPTIPHNNALPNTSIMSVAAAFAASSSPTRSQAPSTQTSVAVSTESVGRGVSVVPSELDEQWAAAAVALAKEGETRVERGERRNPQVLAKKADYIDSLDLSEYEKLVIPARHPHVLVEVEE